MALTGTDLPLEMQSSLLLRFEQYDAKYRYFSLFRLFRISFRRATDLNNGSTEGVGEGVRH